MEKRLASLLLTQMESCGPCSIFRKTVQRDSPKTAARKDVSTLWAAWTPWRTAPAIVIAEGYATAGSISDAIGHATVAAFDSGNLMAVATALKDKYPDKAVIIAGDDDLHLLNLRRFEPIPDVKRRKRLHRPWEVKPFSLSLLPENGKKIWPVLRTSMT